MRVTFLSQAQPIPYGHVQHRCYQPAAYLAHYGFASRVSWIYDFRLDLSADVIILHRVVWSGVSSRLMSKARSMGAIIVYECDDLLFEPDAESYLQSIGEAGRDQAIERRLLALQSSDAVIVPTSTLATAAQGYGMRVYVLRNGLSEAYVERANHVYGRRQWRIEPVFIGYFSGSPTHDSDLAQIGDALASLLEKHSQVQLVLGGRVNPPPVLDRFGDRIHRRRFVPYAQFPLEYEKVDINLAPLDTREAFCNCKSELKYIEAGACGVPTVASPTIPYRQAIEDGVNGFLADTQEEWFRKLERLVVDRDLRQRMGENARKHVLAEYGPELRARQWGEAMQDIVAEFGQSARQGKGQGHGLAADVEILASTLGFRIARVLADSRKRVLRRY